MFSPKWKSHCLAVVVCFCSICAVSLDYQLPSREKCNEEEAWSLTAQVSWWWRVLKYDRNHWTQNCKNLNNHNLSPCFNIFDLLLSDDFCFEDMLCLKWTENEEMVLLQKACVFASVDMPSPWHNPFWKLIVDHGGRGNPVHRAQPGPRDRFEESWESSICKSTRSTVMERNPEQVMVTGAKFWGTFGHLIWAWTQTLTSSLLITGPYLSP